MTSWAARGAAAGSAAVVLAPLLYRIGAPLGLAFLLLAGGFLAAAVSGLLLVLRMLRKTGLRDREAAAALAATVVVGAFPLAALLSGGGAPPIHDITTDTESPPAFVAAVPLNAPGRTDYDPAVAEQQRAAYPDLAPAMLPVAPAAAFRPGPRASRRHGWSSWPTMPATSASRRRTARSGSGSPTMSSSASPPTARPAAASTFARCRASAGETWASRRRVREFVAALSEPQ